MENIEGYCNSIWELAKKNGAWFIHDPRWHYTKAEDLFYTGEPINTPVKPMLIDAQGFKTYDEVGKQCEALRSKYLDNIKTKLLQMEHKNRITYAKLIIMKMSDIGRALSSTDDTSHALYYDFIAPFFYPQVAEIFELFGINLTLILEELQQKHEISPSLTKWLVVKCPKDEIPSLKKHKENIQQQFESLFPDAYKGKIREFLSRLEENHITSNGKYIHKRKKHLAKLVVYMIDKHLLSPSDPFHTIKTFYEYFGITVEEKSNNHPEIVTRKNICDISIYGLSDTEIRDFGLICAVFPPK